MHDVLQGFFAGHLREYAAQYPNLRQSLQVSKQRLQTVRADCIFDSVLLKASTFCHHEGQLAHFAVHEVRQQF